MPEKALTFFYVMTPVIGLFANATIQILSIRYVGKIGLLRSIYFGFFSGLLGVVTVDAAFAVLLPSLFRSPADAVVVNAISYIALGYCYFHFVGLGETARRIRLLTEISLSADGLSAAEILARYNASEIFRKRMERLLDKGQLVLKDGKYIIGKPAVLAIVNCVMLLKSMLLKKKAEAGEGSV